MQDFKISAQLYTVRELLKGKNKDEIYGVMKQIKDIGYDYVHISGIGEITEELAYTYRDVCKKLDLRICATHLMFDDLAKHFDWIVKYHKLWDCEYVGVGIMPSNMRCFDKLDDFIEQFNAYGKRLKENGLTLIYHNHKLEFEKEDSKKCWIICLINSQMM